MLKKIVAICLVCVTILSVGTFAGCKKTPNGEQDLEIYSLVQGYGAESINTLIEEFKKQDWVKEKYPNLTISLSTDDLAGTAIKKLASGSNYNTTDIIIGGVDVEKNYDGAKKGVIENITKSVYESEVPGEGGITVAEKMMPAYLQNAQYGPESLETPNYYRLPMVSGMMGIIYNKTILDKLGLSVPVTTEEFVEQCEIISNKNDANYSVGYAIAENTADGYWHEMFSTWWAQYSGIQEYTDFYYGLVGNVQTSDVYKATGRLRALEVFESIFRPNKESTDYKYDSKKETYKYIYPYANETSTDYLVVQSGFLAGNGVFHANGDWFSTEMDSYRKGFEGQGYVYEFEFMRVPIISSIIETLKDNSVENDEELRSLVRAIDSGSVALTGEGYSVTQRDFDRVKQARCLVPIRSAGGARIPTYASAKGVAIDFLRFTATDIAQKALMKNAFGQSRPFYFDIDSDDTIKDAIDDIQNSKLGIFYSENVPMVGIPQAENFPYGIEQFNYYKMWSTSLEALFSSGKKYAVDIYQQEIDYWKDAQTLWQQMISSAQ